MNWNLKKRDKQKHLFKSYYCSRCNQNKVCERLNPEICCPCSYQEEQEKAQEHNSYEEALVSKQIDRERRFRQLQLLRSYRGCKKCRSKEVDAYFLYENNRLVCQPCRMKKEGGSSHPISFTEQSKWYKKHWKIDLTEWLENFLQLPVNAKCAKEWLKDKEHLDKCECLEIEAQELYFLFANSLRESEEQLKDCQCETSPKTRVDSDYYAWCERCESGIPAASKKRVIKNRNDPRFWGLELEEKVLCLECLRRFREEMPIGKRYTLNKYLKRGYE